MNTSIDISLLGSEVIASLSGENCNTLAISDCPFAPLVITPKEDKLLDVFEWAVEQKENIKTILSSAGAILFRGFLLKSNEDFIRFGGSFVQQWSPYVDRATKRSPVSGPVFTSTDTPPQFDIPLHNESSFTNRWPQTIFFFCHIASSVGGRTPIVDVRKVYQQIDPNVRDRIESEGVL